MKKLLWLVLVMPLAPMLAMSQSAFEGTWKIDVSTAQMPKKPRVLLLQNGTYQCKTCVPVVDVKADGQDQKVTGHPYYDAVNVKVIDDRSIEETDKKDGKTVVVSKTTVSSDNNTATFEFTDSSATNSEPVTGKGEMTRVAKGPAGSNAISGSWRTTKFETVSDNGLTFTYKVEGDSLTMTTPTGQTYTAKMDGTDAPFKGDPGTTSVSVKRLSANVIEEMDKRDGKVISVNKMTLAPNGKTMTIAVSDKLYGTTSQFTAQKQ